MSPEACEFPRWLRLVELENRGGIADVCWRRTLFRRRKNAADRIGAGGLVVQRTVDAVMMVVEPPAIGDRASFFHAEGDPRFKNSSRSVPLPDSTYPFSEGLPLTTLCESLCRPSAQPSASSVGRSLSLESSWQRQRIRSGSRLDALTRRLR